MSHLPRSTFFAGLVLAAILPAGCMPRMTIQEIADMRPPRPPELDRLDRLVGDWETVGEVRMTVLDEALHTGRSSARWILDKRFLREDAELELGELGKVTGTSIWSFDPAAGKYHMWWFDSLGETSHAVITFDPRADAWFMRTRGRKYGYATSGRGTLRHLDDDTLEWTWQEFDATGLFRLADMKGVSRRR
jgi:hypothetical protein